MPRDIVARRKNGKLVTWYVTVDGRRIALRTKDATEARRRARLARAGQWPPLEEESARVSEGAFAFGSAPVPETGSTPPEPAPGPAPGDWTSAAAGASADAAAPPLNPDVMPPAAAAEEAKAKAEADNAEFAKWCVAAQIGLTTFFVRRKVYAGFRPPPLPDDGRDLLAAEYKKMLDYGGAALKLPPWVTGLIFPACTVISAAVAIGAGYSEIARKQKREDGTPAAETSYAAAA